MKTNELKKVLKPLIKQTIREVLLEEGILSQVVSEVVRGMGAQTITEVKRGPDPADIRRQEEELERQRQERIKRLNETVGPIGARALTYLKTQKPAAESSDGGAGKALVGTAYLADDPGVDISGIMKLAGGKWGALKG
jgi:hypothetical protein